MADKCRKCGAAIGDGLHCSKCLRGIVDKRVANMNEFVSKHGEITADNLKQYQAFMRKRDKERDPDAPS